MLHHLGTTSLETERLVLRRFMVEDAEAMYRNWANDPEVTRYLTWPSHVSVEVTRQLLAEWVSKYENKDFYNWAIVSKANGEAVGNVSFVSIQENIDEAVLGYVLSRRLWGQGYMPEACRAVFDFGFTQIGLNRIEAAHHTENPKSGRVMQKLGMIYEGLKRQANRDNQGNLCDTMHYAILKQDWGHPYE